MELCDKCKNKELCKFVTKFEQLYNQLQTVFLMARLK